MANYRSIDLVERLGDRFKMDGRNCSHVVYIDPLKPAGGEDARHTLLESLFLSIAGYIGAIGRIVAYQKNLPLRSMDTMVSGELDTEVLMGKFQENRTGFPRISVMIKIDADMSLEERRNFLHEVAEQCLVSDNLKPFTEISMDLE